MNDFRWCDHIDRAMVVLAASRTATDAAETLTQELKHTITKDSLLSAVKRAYARGEVATTAQEVVGTAVQETPSMAPGISTPAADKTNEHMSVVRAVQKGADNLTKLADVLDCSPKKAREAVGAAIAAGHDLHIGDTGTLSFEMAPAEVLPVHNVPVDSGFTVIGVISDLHVGSKHCFEQEIGTFVEKAYAEGARQILIPGDLCEGDLRHHGFKQEVKCFGFDMQTELLCSLLPQLDGLTYYYCAGNHEVNSWWKTIGIRPDRAMMTRAQELGRNDLVAAGAMIKNMESAYLCLNPGDRDTEIKVELSRTDDKKAYAISYPLQKHVEAIQPGDKPHVLLKGHLHSHSFFDLRGVVCVQTACFKGQGAWERQKRMQPQVGGILLWLRRQGRYFDTKHYWSAIRPAPTVWVPTC